MTLVDVLLEHASSRPDATAYVFVHEDGRTDTRTFAELARRAQAIAAELGVIARPGDRALLLYQPSLDFIDAILGCFLAGVIAVPVAQLRNSREIPRMAGIVRDAGARLVLSNTATREATRSLFAKLPAQESAAWLPTWLATDTVASARADQFRPLPALPALAFLQYTSGSTGSPKGVMVTHANVMHNQRVIKAACLHDESTIFAGWLPFFHDMGLIGNVFQPLYLGIKSVLFSPITFLLSPVSWLRTVSKYRATTSGGPSFAYELCAHQIADEDLAGIDLSSWRIAFNGAEPVKAHVIDAFIKRFSPYGFDARAFYPCYGLAEATLFVTGGRPDAPVVQLPLDAEELRQNQAIERAGSSTVLVGCGQTNEAQIVRIVDPGSLQILPDGQIGEIWQAGGSVAAGYWGQPEATAATFQAHTADGQGPFLRTGDLGFWKDGELFVSGRLKDVIIVRGRNYYPQDLECAVYEGRAALRPGGAAAFTVERDGEDKLVVVAEVNRTFFHRLDEATYRALVVEVRAQIADQHGLRLFDLVLIRPGGLPKTSSGKIRRRHCRELYESNGLPRAEVRQTAPANDASPDAA